MFGLPLWVLIAAVVVGGILVLLAGMYISETFALGKARKLSALSGRQFSATRFFEGETIAGFRFMFRLDVLGRCINPEQFAAAKMDNENEQQWFVQVFNAHA